ncbi:hypothetical protein SKAU_G00000990 [Synaphobranchus kaupii]|uniref:Uncharacterized protein n=1 Tax=Synaphobranchus kaupii TaxID=118154 RepID=A0A9Q1G882_SYNKA|nr:hypothetical protein SKAU_G00000990 [Synaphobranchus kaupii]
MNRAGKHSIPNSHHQGTILSSQERWSLSRWNCPRFSHPQRCKKPCVYQESQLTAGGSVSTPAVTDSTPLRLRAEDQGLSPPAMDNQTKTPCTEGSGGVTMASLKHKQTLQQRRAGPELERTYENNVPSPYGRSCFDSALLDCTNGGRTGFVSAPGPPSSDTGVLTIHLAGVPVKSFDSVTIDSDLDSVRTDRVRKHFQNALRCGAAVRCARGLHLEDLYTDQSDPDLLLEPRSKFSLQSLRGNAPGGSRPVRKSRHPRRETSSAVVRYDCSDNEDTDEVEEEEEEQAGLSGLDPRGLVQRNSAPWRRRSSRLKRPHLRTLTGGWLDVMNSDRMLLEESLHTLRQNCLREEERLKQKRDQLYDTEQSLTTLLQQKKHAVQELECARATAEQAQREGRGLEASLRDSRAQADSTRSQLRMLQTQRDDHMTEMIDLEEELTALRRHKAVLQERTGAELEKRFHTNSLSVLEREELDRQLDSAKTELFAEQRRARHKLDSLQERLEEAQQELDQRVEEVRVLKESCTDLEEQLTDAQRHREELEQRRREEVQTHKAQVQELQGQLEEQAGRVGALDRLLAQEEVGTQEQLSALQEEKRSLEEQRSALQEEKRSLEEQRSALQEEKRSLEAQLLSQREAHCTELRQTQEQAGRDKELELEQLRSELSLAGEQEIEQVLRQAEEDKKEALKEQALSHTQHSDTLHARIQLKEEELRKLKDSLERQEESERERAEELRAEAQKTVLSQVRQAVEREHRKWEAQKGAELQNKIVELQTRVQEQDSEERLQQREHAAALAAVRRALREEQQTELQQLRRHLEQEAQREVSRLQQAVQQAQGEAQALQAALAERGRSHEEGVSRVEQQQRGWATDLGAECQRLRELLEQCGATGGAVHLPHNPTVAQVVQTFHSMREQLYTLVSRLQQDLDTQRHATQQLSRDKERELRTQKEQLTVEREQALDSLRERLIQDHIEELSSLQRAQLRDSNSEAGGVAASLRRQLQEKDSELREVQRSMGRWKEQTAARLARKFEEELTSELERCKAQLLKERRPRARMDQQRKLQRLETEMRQLTTEYGGPGVLRSTSTPSLLSLDPPAAPGPPDLATFKLLRHLQSRVRLLRAENSVQTCSPVHLGTPHRSTYLATHLGTAGELAGSYLETIAPSSERCQVRSRVQSRTAPN